MSLDPEHGVALSTAAPRPPTAAQIVDLARLCNDRCEIEAEPTSLEMTRQSGH